VYRAETAKLLTRLKVRCAGCGYSLGGLGEPCCPECGRAVDLRSLGWFGMPAEIDAALRLRGPAECGRCHAVIVTSVEGCCGSCGTPISPEWIGVAAPKRGRRFGMSEAIIVGAVGVVLHVVPAAVFLVHGRAWGAALMGGLCLGWMAWMWRVRTGRARERPWLAAALAWGWVVWTALAALG